MVGRIKAAISLCLFSVAAFAGLSGHVLDPDGRVVRDASVIAVRVSDGVGSRTRTNKVGVFHLDGLTPGDYELRVLSPGFRPDERRVDGRHRRFND